MHQTRLGISTTEYGILGVLILIAGITMIQRVGNHTSTLYCSIAKSVNNRVSQTDDGSCTNNGGYGSGATYNITSNGGASCTAKGDKPTPCTLADAQVLYLLNKIDPITGVYGLKNNTGSTTTTYTDALAAMTAGINRSYGVSNSTIGQTFQYEVQGQSGTTYGVYYTTQGFGVRNMINDTTYQLNWNTGSLDNIGTTTNSGGS